MIAKSSILTRLRRRIREAIRVRAKHRKCRQILKRKRGCDQQFVADQKAFRPIVLDAYVPQNFMHLVPLYHALKKRGNAPIFVAIRDASMESRRQAIERGVDALDILMGDTLMKVNPALTVSSDYAWEWLHPLAPDVSRVQIFHGCLLKSFSSCTETLPQFTHFFFSGAILSGGI